MKRKVCFFGLFILILTFSNARGENTNQKANISSADFGIEDAVINVAGTTGKAVVSITSEHVQKTGGARRYYFRSPSGESPFGEDEFFQRFFEDFFGEMPEREYKQLGLGSGVIINSEGYILTNEHVISGADKISVILSDGREFKAEVKGVDQRSDLAVIKISATNLPVAKLGNSDELKIGQWVVAIGNPFGFALRNPEPTVTTGVVSALHRSLGGLNLRDKDYNDLIQTDAAINPGNSGGPLVNLKGEVVGINVAIFSTSGGYQGMGFAIPVNNAKRIISRLIEGKKIVYGWVGVSVQDLNEDLAKYFGLPDKNGTLIIKVFKDSPAEKAGLKEKDIIKQIDNQPVNNTRELLNLISKLESGKRVRFGLIREKKALNIDVIIGERPSTGVAGQEAGMPQAKEDRAQWRGLAVEDIDTGEGLRVIEVAPNSPAEKAGMVPGDRILEINRVEVNNVPDFKKVVKDLTGETLVRTQRGYFLIKER